MAPKVGQHSRKAGQSCVKMGQLSPKVGAKTMVFAGGVGAFMKACVVPEVSWPFGYDQVLCIAAPIEDKASSSLRCSEKALVCLGWRSWRASRL